MKCVGMTTDSWTINIYKSIQNGFKRESDGGK